MRVFSSRLSKWKLLFLVLLTGGLLASWLAVGPSRKTAEANTATQQDPVVIQPEARTDCAWFNAAMDGIEMTDKYVRFLEQNAETSEAQASALADRKAARRRLWANFNSGSYYNDASACVWYRVSETCPSDEDPNSWRCQKMNLPACITQEGVLVPNRSACAWGGDNIPINRKR